MIYNSPVEFDGDEELSGYYMHFQDNVCLK